MTHELFFTPVIPVSLCVLAAGPSDAQYVTTLS